VLFPSEPTLVAKSDLEFAHQGAFGAKKEEYAEHVEKVA
jgi:hypothetical protein